MLAVALLALLAAADPTKAKVYLYKFIGVMTDERFFWLCVALVGGYFLLWWITSIEPKSRRKKIQDGLRPLFRELSEYEARLKNAGNDEELKEVVEELNVFLQKICQWIIDNMGGAAFTKFNHAQSLANSWTWPNNPNSELAGKRSNTICFVRARLDVLDLFLQSDGWDGQPVGRWPLIKRNYAQWKEK